MREGERGGASREAVPAGESAARVNSVCACGCSDHVCVCPGRPQSVRAVCWSAGTARARNDAAAEPPEVRSKLLRSRPGRKCELVHVRVWFR